MYNDYFDNRRYDYGTPNHLPRLEMERSEMHIYSADDEQLQILGDILSYSKDWPQYVCYKDMWYKFEANEVMPDFAVGNYHGHSVYNRVDTNEVPEKYLSFKYYL